ncbi:MAG: serine/threonine-protein kinase [Archangium sp.]|nr:serine/threonine-protein kinase [Archangium sp.]
MSTLISGSELAPILLHQVVPPALAPTMTSLLPAPSGSDGLSIGSTLGAYIIERELGAGSMGHVYQALHQRLGRRVALKVLRTELLGEPSLVERFLQEGRAVNQIDHANIVEVHDYVEERGSVYCVMELLEGQTLAERMEQGPSSLESIHSMALQIASALGASHAAGVVHRDLKPDNIFLVSREGRDDWVKVLDFGIAKCTSVLSTIQTAQGSVLGTPRYMAPEQVAGCTVDGRADIYALGTILHELICGQAPFEASSFGQLAADIINQSPPPLPGMTAGHEPVPPALASLIAACLSKQPSARPPTMEAVGAALTQPTPRPRRRPRFTGLAMLAGLTLVLSSGAGLSSPEAIAAPAPTGMTGMTMMTERSEVTAAEVEEVTLWVETQPPGALVSRLDTGETLGRTPLEVRVERAANVPLRIELEGHTTLERDVSIEESQRLEYMLQPPPKTFAQASRRAVTDGVLDPY